MRREKRTLNKYDLRRYLGEFGKLRKRLLSLFIYVCLSVCPHGTTLFQLEPFS